MLIYDDFIKLRIMSTKFQFNQKQLSIQKKNWIGLISRPFLVSDYNVKIIKLEPSDTLNCQPLFKHFILQTILHVFYLFMFLRKKILFTKKRAIFFLDLVWGGICCYSINGSVLPVHFLLGFRSSFYEV